jgi:hypothetical protein
MEQGVALRFHKDIADRSADHGTTSLRPHSMKDVATSKIIVAGGTSVGQRRRDAVVRMRHGMTMQHGAEGWRLGKRRGRAAASVAGRRLQVLRLPQQATVPKGVFGIRATAPWRTSPL